VGVSTKHLVAFARSLDGLTSPLPSLSSASDALSAPTVPPLENADQSLSSRLVVVLCRDESCLAQCRLDEEMYCFGGFARGGKRRDDREGLDGENGDEVAKLRALVGGLESGRRVFWADECVLSFRVSVFECEY
jgi:hypothetical protein